MDLHYKIISDAPGRLCNRFWSYLDLVAEAISLKSCVFILLWDKDIRYYPNLIHSKHVCTPMYWRGQFPLVNEILGKRLFRGLYKSSIGRKMGFVQGWSHRMEHHFFPAVMDEVKKIFAPEQCIIDEVENLMSPYRRENKIIVGVHVRRSDYKTWQGGKYYYDYDVYISFMKQVLMLYGSENTVFYIASDEKFEPLWFNKLTIINYSQNMASFDLYALSRCDRIFGPLSTFSRWASLYGSVPLRFVERNDFIRSDDEFSVIRDFYHFENGREIVNLSDWKYKQ